MPHAPLSNRWGWMMGIWGLLCIGTSWLPAVAAVTPTSTTIEGDDGKDAPEKGDLQCPSLADRYNDYMLNGDATEWLTLCQGETTDNSVPDLVVPDNGIVLEFYASLPAFTDNLGAPISWFIVAFLNEASLYYRVKLNIDLNFFNSTEEYVPPNGYIAEIEHQMVQPKRTQIFDSHSVWQYQLLFHCHHGEGAEDPTLVGTPIVEEAQLRSIKQDLNQYLRKAVDLIRAFDLLELSNGVLGVSVGDPAQAVIPFIDGPPTLPPTTAPSVPPVNITFPTSAPTSTSQRMHEGRGKDTNGDGIVDEGSLTPGQNEKLGDGPYWEIRVQYWDWRRYTGLALFLGTLIGTLFLTQLAAQRQRRRTVKDLWGNLGTEEGVDALLNTGWKVQGCKMEVYDKKGWGYNDDDSVFLGGYEQRHVGAEITVTYEGDDTKTCTTPDSPNPWDGSR